MKQITLSAPMKQYGAVITLEAMLLVLVGMIMAVTYAIILYDAITNYFIIFINVLKETFDDLANAHFLDLCLAIDVVDPAGMGLLPVGPAECFIFDVNGSNVILNVNKIPVIEIPDFTP